MLDIRLAQEMAKALRVIGEEVDGRGMELQLRNFECDSSKPDPGWSEDTGDDRRGVSPEVQPRLLAELFAPGMHPPVPLYSRNH